MENGDCQSYLEKWTSSVWSAIAATFGFAISFTLLGLFFEGGAFNMAAVLVACFCFLPINLIVLACIYYYQYVCSRTKKEPEEDTPVKRLCWNDEEDQSTLHWSSLHGLVVSLLAVGGYGLLSYILANNETYYSYLLLALIPLSPWLGKIALESDRELINHKSIIALFFHKD